MGLGQLLLTAAALWPLHAYADVLSLSELSWSLKNKEGTIVVPAKVPSQAHLDLLAAGVITEPLLGINDFDQRWIVYDDWTYTANLAPLTQHLAKDTAALLVFYGLDTIATITVAGHPVAWVNNQFQQYVYDVTDLIASPLNGDTNVTVAFESAWTYGKNVTSRLDAEPLLIGDIPTEFPGVRHYIRKIQSDFGWDWGPAFVPSGIFKPAYLVTLNSKPHKSASPASHPLLAATGSVFIEESSLEVSKAGQTTIHTANQNADWLVNVTLAVRSVVAAHSPTITISIPELRVSSGPLPVSSIPASTNTSTFLHAKFTVPNGVPQLWYPHNLGTPHLYNFTVTLTLSNGVSTSFTTRSGFRTIELIQTPYSQQEIDARGITPGDQWHFSVNGKPFYSLGTNVIPFDPFYPRITSAQTRWVLESAVKSGQNMVRVWGGGIYQPSDELTGGYEFYSICDELGILAWSELIFSDALYPINEFLLETIEPEVRQNVRRVNKHPSNAQWAGGNEIELIINLAGVYFGVPEPILKHYRDEFQTLFVEFLHGIVLSEQSSVAYTDCSTTTGVLSLDPYEVRFNNATPGYIYGNTERYNYSAEFAFDYGSFPVARFVNEFGFHSMPSFYSWEEVLQNPADFAFNSTVVMSRDHHPSAGSQIFPNPNAPQGQGQMTDAVELFLPTPGTADSNQTFAQWCWSTQLFQSMTVGAQIAWYRRGAGQGENNLGALVWQLNDVWQGVSWSAIEHSGRWKVMQYGLTSVFSPLTIYPFWYADNERLEVLVTSDRWETVRGAAQLTWYGWDGALLNSSTVKFAVPALNNSLVYNATGLSNILPKGKDAKDVFLLVNVTANVDGRTVTQEQYFTPTSLADANLVDPSIVLTPRGDLTFTLSAKGGVAVYAWLDHPAGTVGYFQDRATGVPSNGFYLIPGIDRTVQFILNPGLSKVTKPNPKDFVVRSVWNNTHI